MAGDEYVTVEVKGLSELQARLEAAPEKLQKKSMKDALKAGANFIRTLMVSLAPKNTGFLSQHFGTKIRLYHDVTAASAFIGPQGKIDYPDTPGGSYRIKRDKGGKPTKVGRIAVATVARFFEFGTSKMGKKPFMTQSFESGKGAALDAITEKLRDGLGDL